MKFKTFALCAIAAAITGCGTDSDNNPNTLGSIALSGTPTSGETLSAAVNDPDGISGTITYYWYATVPDTPSGSVISVVKVFPTVGVP